MVSCATFSMNRDRVILYTKTSLSAQIIKTGTEYAGQWHKNRFHGEGTRRFNNGNVYTGNYVSGKRQGQGKCYFANGDMYVGDWKDDTIHGFGRYYYNNGHR